MNGPDRVRTVPAMPGSRCWASATSGTGMRLNRPSSTMSWAPSPVSSAGWNSGMRVPFPLSRWPALSVGLPVLAALWRAGREGGVAGHERGHPGHGGHVQVVAAGVIDRHLVAAGVGSCGGAREGRAGGLAQRQRVEFATEQDGGAAAVGQDAHHARAADAGLDREAVLPEFVGDPLGGAVLSVGEFGLAVQVLVEGLLGGPQRLVAGQDLLDGGHYRSPPEKISRKNRNTFSTSRKIDAARNGAVATSVLVRSRWKSNMVNPAKMTRPRTE